MMVTYVAIVMHKIIQASRVSSEILPLLDSQRRPYPFWKNFLHFDGIFWGPLLVSRSEQSSHWPSLVFSLVQVRSERKHIQGKSRSRIPLCFELVVLPQYSTSFVEHIISLHYQGTSRTWTYSWCYTVLIRRTSYEGNPRQFREERVRRYLRQ